MANNDELKGKVNEAKGKVTDDESTELKGKIQQPQMMLLVRSTRKLTKKKKISLLDLPRQVYFYIFYQGR